MKYLLFLLFLSFSVNENSKNNYSQIECLIKVFEIVNSNNQNNKLNQQSSSVIILNYDLFNNKLFATKLLKQYLKHYLSGFNNIGKPIAYYKYKDVLVLNYGHAIPNNPFEQVAVTNEISNIMMPVKESELLSGLPIIIEPNVYTFNYVENSECFEFDNMSILTPIFNNFTPDNHGFNARGEFGTLTTSKN